MAYQKSPSVSVPAPERATSVSDDAVRRAPSQVSDPVSGDHAAPGRPVEPVGS